MAGLGTVVGLIIGFGQVWAAFTQPPPNWTVGISFLTAVSIGVVVFFLGLVFPVFTGTAAIGVMIGWVVASVVSAVSNGVADGNSSTGQCRVCLPRAIGIRNDPRTTGRSLVGEVFTH